MTHFIRSYTIETLRGSTDDTIAGLTQLAQCRDFLDKRVKWEESCFQGRSRLANSSASGNAEHQTATS